MIAERELKKAVEIAKKNGVGELYVVGSALRQQVTDARDYDFAVRGVPTGAFFKFYGELIREMSKTVDLIDLSGEKTKFKDIVLREGKLVYAKQAA